MTINSISCRPSFMMAVTSVVLSAAYPLLAKGQSVPESPAAAMGVRKILARVAEHPFQPVRKGFTYDAKLGTHGIADMKCQDGRVRLLALRDLSRLGSAATPDLIDALADENMHVRQLAAEVLGLLNSSEAIEPLFASLAEDADLLVRCQAARSLGLIDEATLLTRLRKQLDAEKDRDIRHHLQVAILRHEQTERDDYNWANAFRDLDESTFGSAKAGGAAPDFTLTDTSGLEWRLADFRGKKRVVLIWIFADWCPVCHSEFKELARLLPEFEKLDTEVLTIECHDPFRCRVMVDDVRLPAYWFSPTTPQLAYDGLRHWPHLIDAAGAVGARYGVDPLAFTVHSEYVNRPSTFVIDKKGIVRFAYVGTFWGDRPTIEETLEMVRTEEYAFVHPQRLKHE